MFLFLWGKCLGMEWLYFLIGEYLTCKDIVRQISKSVVPYHIPAAGYESSSCSIFSLIIVNLDLFNFSHSKSCALVSHCILIL